MLSTLLPLDATRLAAVGTLSTALGATITFAGPAWAARLVGHSAFIAGVLLLGLAYAIYHPELPPHHHVRRR